MRGNLLLSNCSGLGGGNRTLAGPFAQEAHQGGVHFLRVSPGDAMWPIMNH